MREYCGFMVGVLLLVSIPVAAAEGPNQAWSARGGGSQDVTANVGESTRNWLAQLGDEDQPAPKETAAPTSPTKSPPLPLHTIEGVGGCLVVPVAYLVNPGPEGTVVGMPAASFTYINTSTSKSLQAFAVTQTFLRRIEIGYALDRFDLGTWPKAVQKNLGRRVRRHDVYLHNFNVRGMLIEENSWDQPWLPAVTAGVHFKHNTGMRSIDGNTGGAPTSLGFARTNGIDYTLTLSKTVMLGRPFIFTGGMRNSQASHVGLLGFADSCATTVEGSVICLLTDWLAMAYEFRQKENPYNRSPGLVGKEGNWHTICFGLILSDRLTVAGGWARMGELANSDVDGAWGFQIKYEF